MALSKIAQEFAAEIRNHDWSDAPWRLDRAGHSRTGDSSSKITERVLTDDEARRVKTNAMWVTAQVLGYNDPNFDVYEFAEACGLNTRNSRGGKNGGIDAGLRKDAYGRFMRPGTWKFDDEFITTETSDFYHAGTDCDWFRRGYRGGELLRFPTDGEVPTQWERCGHCLPSES